MSLCLLTCIDDLLDMNQTKYLIRPIIMIIRIIKIKNTTRKWTPSIIINSLTNVCISGGNIYIFFSICSYFIKQSSLEWLKLHKTLIMTWAVKEHCSEINVILIQYMSVWLYSGTLIRQVCFIADTSV